MIAHLLQSTIFALAAALLALLLRKNAAQVRHRLWFIASVKFLLPFSLLFSIGGLVPRHVAAPPAQPRWIVTTQEIVQPLTAPTAAVAIPEQTNYLPAIALALWFAGFAAKPRFQLCTSRRSANPPWVKARIKFRVDAAVW